MLNRAFAGTHGLPSSNTGERSESSKAARAQQQPSASATTAEAVAEKSVAAPSDREKALYEEFLEWRVKQLLFQQ